MDITRDHFQTICPMVVNFIKTCDFYSIDTELSGINIPDLRGGVTDPPERSFFIKGQVAMRFSIIQFGICTFHRENPQNPNEYTARPFNFFLFPSQQPGGDYLDRSLERDLVMSPSAIGFNRRHGMDFQKWITQGVEYCNGPQERALLEMVSREEQIELSKKKMAADREAALEALPSPEEKKYFYACETLAKEFMKEVDQELEGTDQRPKEVMLPSTRSRAARDVTRGYLEGLYHPLLLVGLRGKTHIKDTLLIRQTKEEMVRHQERRIEMQRLRVADFVGFRTIYKAMVESRRPVVGHNCFVDLCFTMAAFDEPLDHTNLCQYKKLLNDRFPVIFDTKYIVNDRRFFNSDRFSHISLESIFTDYNTNLPACFVKESKSSTSTTTPGETTAEESNNMKDISTDSPAISINREPSFILPLGFGNYAEETILKSKASGTQSAAHEAGYDAYMTGVVLLKLLAEANLLQPSEKGVGSFLTKATKELGNVVHLHRSLYLLDIMQRDEKLQEMYEGGANDKYIPKDTGVVSLKYLVQMAVYEVQSKVNSLGYDGQLMEIGPGASLMKISPEAALKATGRMSKGQLTPLDEFAAKEINEKFNPRITAEPFVPYHKRQRVEATLTAGDHIKPPSTNLQQTIATPTTTQRRNYSYQPTIAQFKDINYSKIDQTLQLSPYFYTKSFGTPYQLHSGSSLLLFYYTRRGIQAAYARANYPSRCVSSCSYGNAIVPLFKQVLRSGLFR
eukprot:Tbor_TRINITY_DN2463_c0_g1::TRINITY_DN2463_c0_g1_i1::g.2621::m.2621/K01148/PARN, PNLDC1; poly(A)-specific ribonuclease